MHVQQVSVRGEDFVGLLGMGSDSYAILSKTFPKITSLKVPTIRLAVYGSTLVGLFCAGNSRGLLLPYFVPDADMLALKKSLKAEGVEINIERIGDKSTALGNLLACNDNAALISPMISEKKKIEDVLGVEVVSGSIGGHDEVGACCLATNKGFIVHPDAEAELEYLGEIFGVKGMSGSVNFGFPFIKSGLIANSHGYITGRRTTGIELDRIDQALDLLD
jgi:translation initiation factor 6